MKTGCNNLKCGCLRYVDSKTTICICGHDIMDHRDHEGYRPPEFGDGLKNFFGCS